MSLFDKICLSVGKVVVFFLTFLSCFYTADIVTDFCTPYMTDILNFIMEYNTYIVLGSFALLCIIYFLVSKISKFRRMKESKYTEVQEIIDEPITEDLDDVEEAVDTE